MTIVTHEIDYAKAVKKLKEEKNAVILAHYYQEPAIQEIADFVGDSLGLAKQAAGTDADIIVFAGVHFMAETAKILSPNKRVFLPDLEAGCSLASSCTPNEFAEFLKQYPDHVVVSYINCSAEIKTMSDYICTSSNAKKIIEAIPKDKKIVFAPDKNLGRYLINETGRDMVLWDGVCIVHEAFSFNKLLELWKQYPGAKLVVHPESEADMVNVANFVGSTSAMLNYVKNSSATEFIVATEAGILHQMTIENPTKTLIPAPSKEDNTCACSECAFMKLNTLEKLYNCLLNETPEITLSDEIIKQSLIPLNRMLALSN
ncbi:MAG: quinolinate synthase NadA [Bacteroidia bacterium]|nr:quinolinate synthase NadA [Bacteroidia bacterium]MCZ2139994.1 quinolinate synthase NadA [Bacteroidia bacterium]